MKGRIEGRMEREGGKYLLVVLEKDFEVDVKTKDRMRSEALEEHFVHGNSLLERC